MEIIELEKKNYTEWDNFCLNSDDAWFWHTSAWLEYNLNYKISSKPESKSFFVVHNGEMVAVCPLILENYDGGKEFSFGGIPGMTPAFSNSLDKTTKKKIIKYVFGEIDRLAKDNKVKRVSLRFPVLNKSFIEAKRPPNNYLMQFGYLNTSIDTQINDLRETTQELSYHHSRNIKKGLKILEIEIFDNYNITKEVFNKYVELHHKAAERVTRPNFTFDIMYNLIECGEAFLVGATRNNEYVGFSYFYSYKGNVYYGSGCNDPDFKNIPVAHLIHYKAMEWMKEKKYNYYEIGWQEYGPALSDAPSEKEINISQFKRGFGGFTVPLFRGEKYYDKEYFLKVYGERVNKFYSSLEH